MVYDTLENDVWNNNVYLYFEDYYKFLLLVYFPVFVYKRFNID